MRLDHRRWLRDAIQELLIPALEARGFERAPLTNEERRGETGTVFPFGSLRRQHDDGTDIVEVQLGPHRSPCFRLNLGTVPTAGLHDPHAGHIPAEATWVHYLDRSYEMGDRSLLERWLPRWFALSKGEQGRAQPADYRSLVQRAVDRLPEVDALFSDGAQGALRRIDR